MVGGFPRKEGMERKDVMSRNVSIYKAQASALEQHASPNCKVRWVGCKVVLVMQLIILYYGYILFFFFLFKTPLNQEVLSCAVVNALISVEFILGIDIDYKLDL